MGNRKITAAEILSKRKGRGGYTRKQLEEWGVPYPPQKGWMVRLIQEGVPEGRQGGYTANSIFRVSLCAQKKDGPSATLSGALSDRQGD